MPFEPILAVDRIRRVLEDRGDIRLSDRTLLWVNRIPFTPAMDDEIMAYYTPNMAMAAIIPDDARAPLRAFPAIRLEQTEIPNYKHGFAVPQSRLNLLARIMSNLATTEDSGYFGRYLQDRLEDLVAGVWARIEWVLMGMLTDSLVYSANGVKFSLTFGMPSDLKVTPGTLWSNAGAATPIADLQTVRNTARLKYGVELDRLSISQTAFNYMISTTEFQNKAQLYAQYAFPAASFPVQDLGLAKGVFARIMDGMTVEIDDRAAYVENPDGTQTQTRFLTVNKALLTSEQHDNDDRAMDFADGIVTESMPGLVTDMIGGNLAVQETVTERRGPFAYFTSADPQGNPPGIHGWCVSRGFPRKHIKSASAVITTH